MQTQLQVLLVRDNSERSELLKQSLQTFGHNAVAEVTVETALLASAMEHNPDVLVIDSDYPDDALLEHLRALLQHKPMPVVLFTEEGSHETIRKAVQAGVSAYVVDGLELKRLGSILDVAMIRFKETSKLRKELEETRNSLAERKAIDRAKGILMKQRGFDEPQAYNALRKMAMDRNLRIGQVAENVIAVAELLS